MFNKPKLKASFIFKKNSSAVFSKSSHSSGLISYKIKFCRKIKKKNRNFKNYIKNPLLYKIKYNLIKLKSKI